MDDHTPKLDLDRLQKAFDLGYERRKASSNRTVTLRSTARLVKNTLLEGRIGRFSFQCDEPPDRGGDDLAPSPLEYFVMGSAF